MSSIRSRRSARLNAIWSRRAWALTRAARCRCSVSWRALRPPHRQQPILPRVGNRELALLPDPLLLKLPCPLRAQMRRLALALERHALALGAELRDLPLPLQRLTLALGAQLGGLALSLGGERRHAPLAQLRLALGACLRLRSQSLVALGAQIGLGADARGRRRLTLACLRPLLGGEARLVALLHRLAAGGNGLALLRLTSSHRLALLLLTGSIGLALLPLAGRNGLALLLLALANGGLAVRSRLLALLRPLLLPLRPAPRRGLAPAHRNRRLPP